MTARTIVLLLFFAGAAMAQEPSAGTLVKVEIVISKYDGDELTTRLPYELTVSAVENPRSMHFRMGVEVPVVVDGSGTQQYRNVGTNIDCSARPLDDERFRVQLKLEQSSMVSAAAEAGNPLFRTFSSSYDVALGDGETVELTSGTDPVSGEVTKVSVSLSVPHQ